MTRTGDLSSRGGGVTTTCESRLICSIHLSGRVRVFLLVLSEGREDTEDVLCFDRSVLDRQLAVRLVMFPVAVNDATATFLPSKLTAYLFSLCLAFNAFYEQCEVVNAADESVRFSRHLLVRAFARVLEKGLELLGIDTLDKM